MTRRAIALLGTAFAFGFSGPAIAQVSMGGMNPATMTCQDLADMDEDQAQGAVYFVAGYQHSEAAGSITGTTGTSATSGDTGAAMGGTGLGGTGTGTSTGTDTTAGATGTATTGTGSTATPGTTGSSTMASVGFDQISVDEIMSACEESPERMVMDVLREQGGAASQ